MDAEPLLLTLFTLCIAFGFGFSLLNVLSRESSYGFFGRHFHKSMIKLIEINHTALTVLIVPGVELPQIFRHLLIVTGSKKLRSQLKNFRGKNILKGFSNSF